MAGSPQSVTAKGRPAISVVMATYNRAEILRETLACMALLPPPPEGWELIVVDNNCKDATPDVCREFEHRVPLRYLLEPKQGKGYAFNAGMGIAEGGVVLFTDDDISPDGQWLVEYARAASQWEQYDVLAGPIRCSWPPNTPAPVEDLRVPWLSFGYLNEGNQEGPYPDGQLPNGANLAVRREVLAEGIRYNPQIGPKGRSRISGSETELLLRLRKAGHKFLYVPSAWVTHRVKEHEVSPTSLLKRSFWFGRGDAKVFRNDYQKSRCLFGIPLWLIRRTAAETAALPILMPFLLLGGLNKSPRAFRWCHAALHDLGRIYQLVRSLYHRNELSQRIED
jgi:L-malate glycosyltransferase